MEGLSHYEPVDGFAGKQIFGDHMSLKEITLKHVVLCFKMWLIVADVDDYYGSNFTLDFLCQTLIKDAVFSVVTSLFSLSERAQIDSRYIGTVLYCTVNG